MSEYGIWVSRKGFTAAPAVGTNPKYLSFTGSLLTPKLKSSAIVAMDFVSTSIGRDTWNKLFTVTKTYVDENISIVGFYALYIGSTVTKRVSLQNPFEANSFIHVIDVTSLQMSFEFDLTVVDTYTAVDIEYFVFSDK